MFRIKRFCCCPLGTGMMYVCFIYVMYFGIFSFRSPELENLFPSNSLELYLFKLYWYGGFCVSGLAFVAVVWKKRFMLLPLMVYEVFVFSFRVLLVSNTTLASKPVHKKAYEGELLLLPLQLYVMALEYSYFRELGDQSNIVCHPPVFDVPPSAPCVVDVPACGQFTDRLYPVEYGVQTPYAPARPQVYPPFSSAYAPFPAMPGGRVTLEPVPRPQQPLPPLQPFPLGAPPPYTKNPPPPYTENPPPYPSPL